MNVTEKKEVGGEGVGGWEQATMCLIYMKHKSSSVSFYFGSLTSTYKASKKNFL